MKKSNELIELEKIAGGKRDVKEKLLKIFVQQVSVQIAQIDQCLKTKDWKELKRLAHTMKSAFLYIKMEKPIELTEALISTAGNDLQITKQQVNTLEEICNQIIDEFLIELG